jgi:hypothetical protein
LRRTTFIITAVAVVVLLVFIVRFYYSEADFALENPSWNGFSRLSGTSLRPLYASSDTVSLGSSDTLLIASPARDYTQEESNYVYSFLQRGGKVVIMDDFGGANSLLGAIGSPITINPVPLCEYEYYHINHSFPSIKYLSPSNEMANVDELVCNHPASLNVSGSAYVLAHTSAWSWLDYNDNSWIDGPEKMGTYNVVARADYGNGQLLVISDPDLFINGMVDMGDNQAFMGNILKGNAWVDVGHGRYLTTVGTVYYAVKYDLRVQAAIVLLLFAAGYAYVQRHDLAGYLQGFVIRITGER